LTGSTAGKRRLREARVKSRKKWEKKNGFGQEHRRGRLNRSSRFRRRNSKRRRGRRRRRT
jgi:hypothetical protein